MIRLCSWRRVKLIGNGAEISRLVSEGKFTDTSCIVCDTQEICVWMRVISWFEIVCYWWRWHHLLHVHIQSLWHCGYINDERRYMDRIFVCEEMKSVEFLERKLFYLGWRSTSSNSLWGRVQTVVVALSDSILLVFVVQGSKGRLVDASKECFNVVQITCRISQWQWVACH